MRFEGFFGLTVLAVIVYLLVVHYRGTARVLEEAGMSYARIIAALQGRD